MQPLEFLKGSSAYTIVLFFEQRDILSYKLKTNQALITEYIRKVKQTILFRPDGDCGAEKKLKKKELVFLEQNATLSLLGYTKKDF